MTNIRKQTTPSLFDLEDPIAELEANCQVMAELSAGRKDPVFEIMLLNFEMQTNKLREQLRLLQARTCPSEITSQ